MPWDPNDYNLFKVWMAAVDREVLAVSGLTTTDLADQPFADWFQDGVEPAEAAEMLLEDEGFPF
jgi:hypothetical protein